jgi:hypothetical protein
MMSDSSSDIITPKFIMMKTVQMNSIFNYR